MEILEKRFFANIRYEGDCWIWTGKHYGTGLGSLSCHNKSRTIVQISIFLKTGYWPTKRYHHGCGNNECVNPDHLVLQEGKDWIRRFWSKVNKDGPTQPHMETPCWEWTGKRIVAGYGQFFFDGAHRFATHIVWRLIYGSDVPKGKHVLHRCDNPPCVNPEHLFLGDQKENMEDAVIKNRHSHKETHGMTKLSATDVEAIRAMGKEKKTYFEIALRFGISFQHVGQIINHKRWK